MLILTTNTAGSQLNRDLGEESISEETRLEFETRHQGCVRDSRDHALHPMQVLPCRCLLHHLRKLAHSDSLTPVHTMLGASGSQLRTVGHYFEDEPELGRAWYHPHPL